MAPEYAMPGYLTNKADVYSFGIVALEIASGRSNITYRLKEECIYRLDWVISTTFFPAFVISEFSHSYPSSLIA